MSYPVTITQAEFETATAMTIAKFIKGDTESDTSQQIIKFLNDVVFYTFENAIYPAGDRQRVNAIITAYPETVDQIKGVMYKVGEYMLKNGYPSDNFAMYAGIEALENGSVEVKDTQDVISKILPPNVMSYILGITPSIVYAGGYRNV